MTETVHFAGASAVERRGVCRVCHRALKNPKYVEAGIGPVCARKQGVGFTTSKEKQMSRSLYEQVLVDQEKKIVWIRDLDCPGCMSVTNDAERVCREMNERHPGYRIVYRDTIGRWDELVHENGRFINYKPGTPDLVPAAMMVRG